MAAQPALQRRTFLGMLGASGLLLTLSGCSHTVEVTGVGGSEKEGFFKDPEVAKVFERAPQLVSIPAFEDPKKVEVPYEASGSRELSELEGRTYDFAFPAGAAAEERIRAKPNRFNTAASSERFVPFSSLLVIGTFREIADALLDARLARNRGAHVVLDIKKYLEVRADQPLNRRFIFTTDPTKSNSAAAFIALVSHVLLGRVTVSDDDVKRAVQAIAPPFDDQGLKPSSTEYLFDQYTGPKRLPMVAVYESQFLYRQANSPGLLPPGYVMMHTDPPVLTEHAVVPFTQPGIEVARLLKDNDALQGQAVRHGFRGRDTQRFAQFFSSKNIPVLETFQDQVPWPGYEQMEKLISGIGPS